MNSLAEKLRQLSAALQVPDRCACEFCFGITGHTEAVAADALELQQKTIESLDAQIRALEEYIDSLKHG